MALDDANRTDMAADINASSISNVKLLVTSGLPMQYNMRSTNIEQVFQKNPPSRGKRSYSVIEDQSTENNKRIRIQETAINKETIAKAVNVMNEEYVRKAVRMLISVTMHGSASVTICSILNYPDYTPSIENQLMEQLERALRWYIMVGFIPFKINAYTPSKRWEDRLKAFDPYGFDSDDSDFDWIDSFDGDSPDSAITKQDPPPFDLYGQDLLFQVPPLGMGEFLAYFHTPTNRIKIDFIKTWKDPEDPDDGAAMDIDDKTQIYAGADHGDAAASTRSPYWFVYTREEPVKGEPQSAIVSMLNNYEAFVSFKSQDRDANHFATHPIPITQERPPQKTDTKNFSMGNGLQQQGLQNPGSYVPDNFNNVKGFPSSRGKPSNKKAIPIMTPAQQANTESQVNGEILTVHLHQNHMAALFQNHTVDIADGRVFAGLITPHAYTSITQRENDYIQQVSVALMVPVHILLSHSPTASASVAGASAGGKKQSTATGAKQAKAASSQQSKSSGGSGYSADPIFIPALEYRKILKDFFSCVIDRTHGSWTISEYLESQTRLKSEEMKLRTKLIADYEARIEKALKEVQNYKPPSPLEPHPALSETSTSSSPSGSSSTTTTTNSEAVSIPEPPKVPSAEAITELTKRRAEVDGDLQQLRNAVDALNKVKDMDRSVNLEWRLPFITDTGNPIQVIEALGGPPELGISIARSRLGLSNNF